MKNIYFAFLLLIVAYLNSFSQNIPSIMKQENKEIKQIAKTVNTDGYILLKDNVFEPNSFFNKNKAAFGLSGSDEMRIKRIDNDEAIKGQKHYRYSQYYKGIEVKGADYLIHSNNLAHGKIVESLNFDPNKRINEKKALLTALNSVTAKKYAWEDQNWEREKRKDCKDSSATWHPKASLELDLLPGKHELIKENYALVYKFKIRTIEPDQHLEVWIDANSGKLLKRNSLNYEANGTFTPLYSAYGDSQNFNTRKRGIPYIDYVLEDNSRGSIIAKKYKNGGNWGLTSLIDHKGNNWGTSDQQSTTAYWIVQNTYDYYTNTFGRRSFNGGNRDIRIFTEWPNTVGQAQWAHGDNADYILVGYDPSGASRAELDVLAHEFTHGVTHYAAGLVYEGEPGALNESFSDIFGTAVERYVLGSNNWLIGEQAGTLRSMSNPLAFGDPDFYGGIGWRNPNCTNPNATDNDFCGVHTNSGVQNHWFFLLSQRIGFDAAISIAYRNLTLYLQAQSNYADARAGSIQAAIDLFGQCSNEFIQTANTWSDVGVGQRLTETCLNAYISGPTELEAYNEVGTWTVHPTGGTGNYSFDWYFSNDNGNWYSANEYGQTVTATMWSPYLFLSCNVISGGQAITPSAVTWCPNCPDPNNSFSISIQPNPATEFINVSVSEKVKSINNNLNEKIGENPIFEYKLYDQYGLLKYENLKGSKTEKINTNSLSNGIYNLTIKTGKEVLNKKLIIDK